MEIKLPNKVKYIIDEIYNKGYEAFIVGGCVRDSILGVEPNDYDITTNAKPEEIINIFKEYKIIDNGIKHGTVGVVIDKDVYEITTYRLEGEYEDNRRPKSVEYTSDIIEDLKRRDFTINAMAYNDKVGLIDRFDGIKDIKNKVVKTVGDPDERFNEDGLRIIRAIRFSSKLGFMIENKTLRSIYKNSNIIKNISIERITEEFSKTILSKKPQRIILLYDTGIFEYIGIDYDLNKDDYLNIEKKLRVLRKCDENIVQRLVMLEYILNIDKINKLNMTENKRIQYYKEIIQPKSIINTLKYSKKIVKDFNILIEYMFIDIDNVDLVKIKLVLNKIGYDNLKSVINLKKIYNNYCLRNNINENIEIRNKILDSWINEIIRIEENNECYRISDLRINGENLKDLGYRGKEIGDKLNLLLDIVIKNPELNIKEKLIDML